MNLRVAIGLALALGAAAASVGTARADEPPYDRAPPFLVGPQQQGLSLVLSVAAGGFGGKHLTFTYEWNRCDAAGAACAPIPGATDVTAMWSDEYVETAADAGHTVRVLVTGTNSLGSTSSWSNPSPVLPAPGAPLPARAQGRLVSYEVPSAALGHPQRVDVYLPPGYGAPGGARDPVLYLLHGYPGSPSSLENSLAVGAAEDELLAERRMRPLVLVIPYGAPGPAVETSWLNSAVTGRWETFVTRDVVGFADRCLGVALAQRGRGVAGLSDGGFGALNMAIHNPAEFRLVESWSGYEHADATEAALAGASPAQLAYDSPATELPLAAPALRRRHVDFWLYVGVDDSSRAENVAFAQELAANGVAHTFRLVPGSHVPSVYRANLPAALVEASRALSPGTDAWKPPPAGCPAAVPLAPGL